MVVQARDRMPPLLLGYQDGKGYDDAIQSVACLMSLSIPEIVDLLNGRAHTWYGQEAISQLAATQWPSQGEGEEGEESAQDREEAPPTTDDLHQYIALPFLRGVFGDAVLDPIKLHVEAKRYLCATDPDYWEALSPASKHSLVLQGGVHSPEQASAFEALPFSDRAARLRRYDDLAKVPGARTPGLEHYEQLMRAVAL